MNIIKKISSKIYKTLHKIDVRHRFNIKNKDVTIFSNNCIGGFLYKNLNTQYQSPTVNLQIPLHSFFKFVNNYEYYLNCSLREGDASLFQDDFTKVGGKTITFPCAWLDDIKVLFQHGKSFDDEKQKWIKRSGRIKRNNIVVICWAPRKLLTDDILNEFSKIKYKKVMITDDDIDFKDVVTIKMAKGKNWFDRGFFRPYFEKYNWKKFFNRV